MSTAPKPAPIPDGYSTVSPWVISRNTALLIDFMVAAFDAVELARVPNPNGDGSIGHAEARIGDSVILMFDARPEWVDTPAYLRLYVEDGEAVVRRAVAAGASVVTELTELAWGDRVGRVRDPLGNVWWIQQRLEEVDPEEMVRRMSEPRFVEAMQYVQGTEFVPRRAGD